MTNEWKPADTSNHPRASTVETIPFDEDAITAIAETLAADVQPADFRLPASRVWQVMVPQAGEKPAVMLTLWPGIKRVDAVNGLATVVFSGVQTVDLVPGVEVQLRKSNRDCLIVARSGKIVVRA